ncbi:ABC transporter permease [Solihabitans fulvus]|uniref:Transport permease protein n=2 Tax=Solihabitans fulvus TaxID=1892852 RepID=A0A5B2WP41_9PSEU|nr:ABC transporter permease [Solihabitans fulvus]
MLRNPTVIVFGLSQPLLYLVLFGPLLGSVGGASGSSWQWFVPGLLVQLSLFGTAYAGFSLIPEIRSGVVERMRVTPVSRTALLFGRVLKDVLVLVVQAALLTAAATLFGFRASVWVVLLGLVLIGVLGVAVGAASYALALKLRQEYAFAPVLASTVIPLMLLSGVLLPMDRGPGWLYGLSRANPLAYVVEGERALMAADLGGRALTGGLVAVALVAVCASWGVRTFHRENA